jgi:hypothetical protein
MGPGGPGGQPGPREMEQLLTSTLEQMKNVADANGIDFEMLVSRVVGRGGGSTPPPPMPGLPGGPSAPGKPTMKKPAGPPPMPPA